MEGTRLEREPGAAARERTVADYQGIRYWSEYLCEPLAEEDHVIQTVVETSPPKWHLAHVSWFFETFLLQPYLSDYQPFHPRFDYLFNSYYEQLDSGYWPRPERGAPASGLSPGLSACRSPGDQRGISPIHGR